MTNENKTTETTVNINSQKPKRKNFLFEMAKFLWKQKAYWLVPVILFLILLIFLIAVGTSPVSPFIYTVI